MAAAFSPYERVRDSSGSRGTVRYVGPVATSKNASTVWVGVEWDDATRGKHDGAVEKDGVETRYFRCPAGAGSFIKPSKLSRGERFLSALKERYQKTDGPAADELYVPTMRGNKVAIELKESARVTRRQQIDRNENISLEHSDVAFAGEDEHIREEASNIVVLNMVSTMLHSWLEVGRIAAQLPRLERLDLGNNKLQPMRQTPPAWIAAEPSRRVFDQLTVLVLNKTGTCWGWLQRLHDDGCLPMLEELHLCSNGIDNFSSFGADTDPKAAVGGEYSSAVSDEDNAAAANGAAGGADALATARTAAGAKVAAATATTSSDADGGFVRGFNGLHTLVLNDNSFSSWAQLRPLSRLPKLRNLALNANRLERVEPRTLHVTDASQAGAEEGKKVEAKGGGEGGYFDSLAYVSLSHNRISEWASIDNLSTYPCFNALRCLANPVTKGMGTSEARQVIVARLGALVQFNNAEVRHYERIEAEKAYVLRMWLQMKAAAASPSKAGADADTDATSEAKTETETKAETDETKMQIDPMTGLLVPISRHTGVEAENDEQRALLQAHPRYPILLRKWGLPQQALVRGAGDGTLGSQLVSLTIRSNCIDTITAEPVTKKVPMSMTVKTLKMLACRAFGPSAPSVQAARLFYQAAGSPFPMPLDQDDRELLFYCVQDGGKVLLQEADEEAEAREQEEAEREQREHLERQISEADAMAAMQETQRAQETRNVLASASAQSSS